MKITIVGSGKVGSSIARLLAIKQLADEIVLIDINEGLAKGTALDLLHASSIDHHACKIIGTKDYEPAKNSELYIITAGAPRNPGMSRKDLFDKNSKIAIEVSKNIREICSDESKIIVITNPVDAISYVVKKVTGFDRRRVIGLSGVLDSARMRYYIANELDVAPENVTAIVIGGHGNHMVPLVRYSTVGGIPITQLLSKEKIEEIVERTKRGGAEVLETMGFSAFNAPASSVVEMIESIIKNKRKILPCSVYLQGEYGVEDCFIGVPVVLGKNGLERIIEVELDEEEKKKFLESISEVKALIEKIKL